MLQKITKEELGTLVLKVDNKSAIALAKNTVLHDRSKHIGTRFHFIRECVDGGRIILEYVETNRKLADILTKAFVQLQFQELRASIGIEEIKQELAN